MRNRKLTGQWAGFSFMGGRLITPEGRDFGPEDLKWLSLTVGMKQEWQRLMEFEKQDRRLKGSAKEQSVIYMHEVLAGAYERMRQAD